MADCTPHQPNSTICRDIKSQADKEVGLFNEDTPAVDKCLPWEICFVSSNTALGGHGYMQTWLPLEAGNSRRGMNEWMNKWLHE